MTSPASAPTTVTASGSNTYRKLTLPTQTALFAQIASLDLNDISLFMLLSTQTHTMQTATKHSHARNTRTHTASYTRHGHSQHCSATFAIAIVTTPPPTTKPTLTNHLGLRRAQNLRGQILQGAREIDHLQLQHNPREPPTCTWHTWTTHSL